MSSEAISTKTRRASRKNLLINVLLLAGALLLFLWSWWRMVNRSPVMIIPTPAMPPFNAYDTYLKASVAIRDAKTLDNMQRFTRAGPRSWIFASLYERQRLTDENAPALALLREGLRHEYRPHPTKPGQEYAPYTKFRQLASLLALDVTVKADTGDWNGAINSRLDQIEFSESLYHGAGFTGLMIGAACQKTQLPYRGDLVDHLNLQQSRTAASRLEGILAKRDPLSDIFIEEKWSGLRTLDAMFSEPYWRDGPGSSNAGAAGRFDDIQRKAKLMMLDKHKVLNDYRKYMDQCAEIGRTPGYRRLPFPSPPSDPINQIFAVNFNNMPQTYDQEERANKLFLIKIALRAYTLQHGRHPNQLSELVPVYLPELPEDPMGANGQFGYQRSGDAYVLFDAGSPPTARPKPQNIGSPSQFRLSR